jgi:hypothetical protein
MNRSYTRKSRIGDHGDYDFVPGSMAYRIGLVWPLTKEVASLNKRYDVEQPLLRHITRLIRRKR